MSKHWTDEEIAYLREQYPTKDARIISSVLGRSPASVRNKAYELGMPHKAKGWWKKGMTLEQRYGNEKALQLRRNISTMRKTIKISDATRDNIAVSHKKFWNSEKGHKIKQRFKIRFGGSNNPMYGKLRPDLSKRNKETLGRIPQHLFECSIPTKVELRLQSIIERYNFHFIYVGNGKKWIGRHPAKNPDFIHSEGRNMIIEVFGEVYHSPIIVKAWNRTMKYNRTYQGTIEHYKKYGYECLIIWDTELKDKGWEERVVKKIKDFI